MKNIILLPVFFIWYHSFGQENPRTIVTRSYTNLKSKKSLNYNASVAFKFFDNGDTERFGGRVFLLKDAKDTINAGAIWYSVSDKYYKFYRTNKIYLIDKMKKNATVYSCNKKEDMRHMSGNIDYRLICKNFLAPKLILADIDTPNILRLLKDTIINNENCYAIDITYPDKDGFTNNETKLYIGKQSYLQRLKRNTIVYQGNCQYFELNIKSYEFNTVTPERFVAKQIPKTFKTEIYKEKNIDNTPTLLDSNTLAPQITGTNFQLKQTRDTVNYYGKITLLDFWYMECFPCINAIKEIEKINAKYKDKKLQIFGVNSHNNNTDNIKKLPHFLEYNDMSYPILLVNDSVANNFKVKVWPTFYIIDQNGKVIYKSVGYSEDLSKELINVIDPLLNKMQ